MTICPPPIHASSIRTFPIYFNTIHCAIAHRRVQDLRES
jgi:hypothetical protein